MKPKNLEKLEGELSQLETRREDLAKEHQQAVEREGVVQKEFISGKANAAAIADAGARTASLKGALEKLDEAIASKRTEVDAARKLARVQEVKRKLVELAQAATSAMQTYNESFLALGDLLQQHAPKQSIERIIGRRRVHRSPDPPPAFTGLMISAAWRG
jgi:chromosome segregation ATPase